MPWCDTQARFELEAPGRRMSCRAVVRRISDQQVRLALLADEGPLLADLTASAEGVVEHASIDELRSVLPALGRLVFQAWGQPGEQRAMEDDRVLAVAGKVQRWYGGDPLMLRRVAGGGADIAIGDYRLVGSGLVAHQAEASGLAFAFRIKLQDIRVTRVLPR